MAHTRRNKRISLILAITLFLTGIYLDTVAEDVFFSCDSTGDTPFYSLSHHADINNLKICPEELLDECSGVEPQSFECYSFLSLLYTNRISPLQGKIFQYLELTHSFCQTMDELVTDHIHQSDGKKRN